MIGINVLSDALKGGSGLDKTSSLKGKNATASLENATAEFAAMLSGLITINANPIGQSSNVGQDLEEGQTPDSLAQNLGGGYFALPFLNQPIGLSDLPAGKEANSGNGVNQGPGEDLATNDNQRLVALSKFSLDLGEVFLTKELSPMPQANKPGITELDKYRQIIADLLGALSGQIEELSPEGASMTLERGTREMTLGIRSQIPLVESFSEQIIDSSPVKASVALERGTSEGQELIKLVQGNNRQAEADIEFQVNSKTLDTVSSSREVEDLHQAILRTVQHLEGTPEASDGVLNPEIQRVIKPLIDLLTTEQGTGSRELSPKASSLLVALNQILTQAQQANTPQGVSKEMAKEVSQSKSDGISKEAILFTDIKQKSTDVDLNHGVLAESSEQTGVKASPNQNVGLGMGSAVGNMVMGNVADGKTVASPVWEQISNVFREQVTSRHQELRELDIKLHPADLGRIHIGLRWENGQVHLQVHASEAATGQIIQNQLLELRQTLTNQGVNCGTLQMGQQGGDQQHNRHGNEAQRTFEQNTSLSEDEEAGAGFNPFFPGQDGHNRLNVIA